MVKVMPSNASAENRVAKPIRISTGKKCSANAARCAAISGDSNGTWYSLWNNGMVESARRGHAKLKGAVDQVDGQAFDFGLPGLPEHRGDGETRNEGDQAVGDHLQQRDGAGDGVQ